MEVKIAVEKKPIEQNLVTQARRSDLLMIWTDCDREGEHIGMEIVRVCRKAKPGIQVKRARFSAIIAQYVGFVLPYLFLTWYIGKFTMLHNTRSK